MSELRRVQLAEAISELRREIRDAMETAQDEALRFRLGLVELELQVELGRETSGKGGLKAWVVEFGGEIRATNTSTHTVKLSLQPIGPGGSDVDVSRTLGRDPTRPLARRK
jgi:hypothetical protein